VVNKNHQKNKWYGFSCQRRMSILAAWKSYSHCNYVVSYYLAIQPFTIHLPQAGQLCCRHLHCHSLVVLCNLCSQPSLLATAAQGQWTCVSVEEVPHPRNKCRLTKRRLAQCIKTCYNAKHHAPTKRHKITPRGFLKCIVKETMLYFTCTMCPKKSLHMNTETH